MREGDRFEFLKHSIWVLLFAAGILAYDTFALASDLPQGRSIGKESISPIMMEDHSDSFIAWRRAKIKQRTVIHIDSHIDIEWISDPDLKRILDARSEQEIRQLQLDPLHPEKRSSKPLSIMNYLYPAIMEGMIKELYWVPPDLLMGGDSVLDRFRSHLIETLGRISIEDLNSFKLQKGIIKGKLSGIPLIVCKLSDLPLFETAVVLDIDVDYFDPPHITKRIDLPVMWPEEFITILRNKGIRSDLISICHSIRGGYLPLEFGFLGEELRDTLKDPQGNNSVYLKTREHRKLGHVYRSQNMYPEALSELHKALELNPADASVHCALGMIYDQLGRQQEAAKEFARAMKIDPVYGNSLIYDADYYLNKKMYAKALSCYERLLKKNPNYLKGYLEAGQCSSKLGRLEAAEKFYKKCVELDPNFYLVHFNLGVIYSNQKNWQREEETYARALVLNPYDGKAYQNLGLLYAARGEIDKAMRAFEKAVEINPCFKEAHNNLGSLHARTGKYAEAMNEFEKAVRIDPRYITGYNNIGKLFLLQGNGNGALKAFQHALAINPNHAWTHFYIGQVNAAQKQYGQAISAYERAMAIDPKFYLAYLELARILGENGMDLERALQLAQKAVELKPTAQGFGLLASLYLKKGMYGEANQAVEKGLALNPGDESILQLKEMMKRKMGGR